MMILPVLYVAMISRSFATISALLIFSSSSVRVSSQKSCTACIMPLICRSRSPTVAASLPAMCQEN